MNHKIRYVALGDSYTIGTGASPEKAWPQVLTDQLNKEGINIELVANPAHNGWTTKDVIEKELPVYERSDPSFATLLIGANDWVQGLDIKTFEENLVIILDRMLAKLNNKKNLILVTIPDFGITPDGSKYGNGRNISEGIMEFNKIIINEGKKRNLKVVDIFPVSKRMENNCELVANDGLHPSAKEYEIWGMLVFLTARGLLKTQ